MHASSYKKMEYFITKYLKDFENKKINVLDVGSKDINGSYKELFENGLWSYTGLDTEKGENVDIIVKNNYNWREIKSNSMNVVVSGQTFEHIEYFWITFFEIMRILRNNGLVCIIAPSGGYEHKFPVDCWRFYPDGLSALAKMTGAEILETFMDSDDDDDYPDDSKIWKDSVIIAKKSNNNLLKRLKFEIKFFLIKIIMKL